MRYKKEIMGLAGLMVLLFHFYIPFGNSAFETYMFRSTFIGVDLFFFVSAYSLSRRKNKGNFDAGKFILNRIGLIYVPFVVLAVVQAIYAKWQVMRLLKVICGIEFFERGGGAFLWYFIGIMLLYLVVPLILNIREQASKAGFLILLICWAILGVILQFGFKYTKLFILINRLPIFFIGLYFDELVLELLSKLKRYQMYLIEGILFVVGTVLTYKFATTSRVNKPFADMYYVIAIPLVLAVVLIVNTVAGYLEGRYKSKILRPVGAITLELYGLQMVFGYNIEIGLLKVVPVPQLAMVLTCIILILAAFGFNKLLDLWRGPVNKFTSTNKEGLK